jgi:hypothetical protein
MACSMNNSGGCLLGWSRFAWTMAGTLGWAELLALDSPRA